MFPLDLIQVIYIFLQEYHKSGIVPFLVHHFRRYMIPLCAITGDVNIYHLFKRLQFSPLLSGTIRESRSSSIFHTPTLNQPFPQASLIPFIGTIPSLLTPSTFKQLSMYFL